MSSNVKTFSVAYNPINRSNVFTSGNAISGQITLELSKDCKIQSVCIKLKGKAEVKWTENHGKNVVTYHSKNKYFSIKQFIIQEGQGDNLVSQGHHVYPFTFQIPAQELPSSFKGRYGTVVYTLEANLSRSMRIDSKAKAEFTILHRANLTCDSMLLAPQQEIVDKKLTLLNSGSVGMDVKIERTGFHQGEGIKVVATIHNKSSREIKPKFCLYSKHSFFAKSKRKLETKEILKEVGDAIPPSAGHTITRILTIPPDIPVSILNCNILKVEYRLKVYLDVKYASDPEVKFPVVILPAVEGQDAEQFAPPAYGFEAFSNSDFFGGTNFIQNPTASGPSAPPLPFDTYGIYPSLTDFDKKS